MLYIIVAEEELRTLHVVHLIMDHHTNICRCCGALVVLNNLCNAFLLRYILLDEASLMMKF
jgi:hypothetical protein